MKRLTAYSLLLIIVLISCKQKNSSNSTSEAKILPGSIGGEFEILIVGVNITDKREIIEFTDSSFHETIPALPQLEYWFRTTYVNLKDLNSNDRRHANILFLSSKNSDNKMLNYIQENIPELIISPEETNSGDVKMINNYYGDVVDRFIQSYQTDDEHFITQPNIKFLELIK